MAKDEVKIGVEIDGAGKATAALSMLKGRINGLTLGQNLQAGFHGLADVAAKAGINMGPLSSGLTKASQAGSALGPLISGGTLAAGAAIAGVAVAAGVAGKALHDLGSEFHEAFETIRVGTGATGEALDALQADFKTVAASVPNDMGDAATAVADLNTRLGLSGEPLQALSTQMVNLARVADVDLAGAIETASGMFTSWNVDAKDMTGTMDYLFRVSQSTGIPIDQLSATLESSGPALRGFGFDLQESAALLGQLDKAGLDSNVVMSQLQRSMGKLAASGKDPKTALNDLVSQINSTDDATQKLALATDVFGSRAAPQMVQAIDAGALSVDGLVASLTGSGDTINGLARETLTVGEKFSLLGNKLKVAFEPMATVVFGAVADSLMWLVDQTDAVIAAFAPIGVFFGDLWQGIQDGFGTAMDIFAPALALAGEHMAVLGAHFTETGGAFSGLGDMIMALAPVIGQVLGFLVGTVGVAITSLVGNILVPAITWIGEHVPAMIGQAFTVAKGFVDAAMTGISNAVTTLWNGVLVPFAQFVTGTLWPGIQTAFQVGSSIAQTAMNLVGNAVSAAKQGFDLFGKGVIGAWEEIKSALATAASWLNRTFVRPITDGLNGAIGLINRIPGVSLPPIGGGKSAGPPPNGHNPPPPPRPGWHRPAPFMIGKAKAIIPRHVQTGPVPDTTAAFGEPLHINVTFNIDAIDGPSVERFFAEHRGKLLTELETAVARGRGNR